MSTAYRNESKGTNRKGEADPETYKTLLKGAVAAYEHNELIEELLRGAIARLVSVVDQGDLPSGLFG
jgi:hypothetical protein